MSAATSSGVWLFGRETDLLVFGGSLLASMLLLALGHAGGFLHGETPPWVWFAAVVLVDVAHVWSTCFRVYFDGAEVRRRPWLYLGVPVAAYVAGALLHAQSPLAFWRALAYVALFHFVRQQVGWVALYRRRAGEHGALDRRLDAAAIYAATLYPVLYWHTHLPRRFSWFVEGDFVAGLPAVLEPAGFMLHAAIMTAWGGRQLQRLAAGAPVCWGKLLVVASTWVCWYGGIVLFDSDYAFTVTNVLIHGVPYFALTFRYGAGRFREDRGWRGQLFRSGWPVLYLAVAALAFGEEALWDRFIWREHEAFFGEWGAALEGAAATLLVPLLALPQAVHYALDGFVWKGAGNPELARHLALPPAPEPAAPAALGMQS
ncbi:MAG: hypothetical protein ACK4N5_17400 [Myxococcales bacterium]